MSEERYCCQKCSFTTTDRNKLAFIDDLSERVDGGERMPYGQCPKPKCGALVHLEETPDELEEALVMKVIAHLRAAGWSLKSPQQRVLIDNKPYRGAEAWEQGGDELFRELQSTSSLVSIPIADGFAYYLPHNEMPLRLQLVPYGDAYAVVESYGDGMDAAQVRKMCGFGNEPPQAAAAT